METPSLQGLGNGSQPVEALAQSRLAEIRAAKADGGSEAGKAIEKLFASMLVKELRRGLDQGFFEGPGSQIYTAWLDEHLGKTLADRDALGLAGLVKTQIDRKAAAEEVSGQAEVIDA